MKIARFRQPAISALAVLLISGAGVAFAANNGSTSAPVQAAPIQQVTPAAEVPDPAVASEHFAFLVMGADLDRGMFAPSSPDVDEIHARALQGVAVFLRAYRV